MWSISRTARILSHYRPRCPIILITRTPRVARQAHLARGLFPLYYDEPREKNWSDDVNARLLYAVEKGKDMGFIKAGSFVVFVVGWSPGSQTTNTMRILQVSETGDVIGRRNEAEIYFSWEWDCWSRVHCFLECVWVEFVGKPPCKGTAFALYSRKFGVVTFMFEIIVWTILTSPGNPPQHGRFNYCGRNRKHRFKMSLSEEVGGMLVWHMFKWAYTITYRTRQV